MRPIKFRGFQNSWIYGGISIFNGEATIYDESCVANSAYEVDINSVGEFTGLKDKNGTEIYEGDFYFVDGYKRVITHQNGAFWSILEGGDAKYPLTFHSIANPIQFEIVGNIYEELLVS